MGFRGLLIFIVMVLLQGCGYALRGTAELPPEMNKVHVRGGSAQLQREFRDVLIESGARVTSPAQADMVLQIIDERLDRRFISLSATGKANEFENVLRVDYELIKPDGENILPAQFIELSTDFFNNQVGIIGKFHEEGILRQELYRKTAETVLRQVRMAVVHARLASK